MRDASLTNKDKDLSDLRDKVGSLEEIKGQLEDRIRTLDHDGQNQTRTVLQQKKQLEEENQLLQREHDALKKENSELQERLQPDKETGDSESSTESPEEREKMNLFPSLNV